MPPTQSPALGGGDLVADALGGDLALELGKRKQDIQRQPAPRRHQEGRRASVALNADCKISRFRMRKFVMPVRRHPLDLSADLPGARP
jgi:hypothetical protein